MNILSLIRILGFLILLIWNPINGVLAQTNDSSKFLLFNSDDAFSQLDNIKKQKVEKPRDLEAAKIASNKIEKLQGQAEKCIEKSDKQLPILNTLLESLQSMTGKSTVKKREAFKYLKDKKQNYNQQAIDCRLFLFQSQEVLTKHKEKIQEISIKTKLMRSAPIWNMLGTGVAIFTGFGAQEFYQASGISSFKITLSIILLAIIAMSLALAIFIRRKCFNWLKNIQKVKSDLQVTTVSVIRKHIIPLLLFGSISAYLAIIFIYKEPSPFIEYICYSLLTYSLLLAILSFLFSPPKPALPILKFQGYGQALFVRLNVLLTLFVMTSIVIIVFGNQAISFQLIEIARSIFLVLLSINVVWLGWLFTSLPFLVRTHRKASIFVKTLLTTILFSVIIVQALGYYLLANHIIFGFLFTFLALVLFYLTIKTVRWVENFLNNQEGRVSKLIREKLGLRYSKRVMEFIFIKFSVYLFAFYGLVLILLTIFGVSINNIDTLNEAFMDGFVLGKIKIIPFQVILSLSVFGVLLVLGRWATSSIRRQHLQGKKDKQDAMGSLFSYIFFCFALIIAMITAGIDFTSLAVIVGALSVGIGLGLQNIVNNFISGIILLVEKPVKQGDRIVIDGKEGVIKKIRLRSTQITTPGKEDIIVPNSDFITQQITNYSFSDELIRISFKVGVVYGSDVKLVKETLLTVAVKHPDVVQDEEDKPQVFFNEFTEDSLNFELCCAIEDGGKKSQITSSLNTMIIEEFEKRNIKIAHPKLNIHVDKKNDI